MQFDFGWEHTFPECFHANRHDPTDASVLRRNTQSHGLDATKEDDVCKLYRGLEWNRYAFECRRGSSRNHGQNNSHNNKSYNRVSASDGWTVTEPGGPS